MRKSTVNLRAWFGTLIVGAILCSQASADDWQLYRYEGRDYISLDNLATFYGFPPPPPNITPPAGAPAVNAIPLPVAKAPAPATEEAVSEAAQPAPAPGSGITLDNSRCQLTFTPNSRLSQINGVTQWLAFAPIVQNGKLLLSRVDLSKTIEPRLRPEKAQGLSPVTTVVLDPGHGGHDHGAVSRYGFEKDFALDVALHMKPILEKAGFKVVMTRAADIFIPLHERAALANQTTDSIFVSIHFNSATSNAAARGFEIYSCAPRGAPATNDPAFSMRDFRDEPGNAVDVPSAVLSGAMFNSLLGHVPLPDRGIKHARFAVLRLCTRPAVLVECGFLSNEDDSGLAALPSWRTQVADALVTGIQNYKELAEQHVAPKMMADYRKDTAPQP